MVAILVWLPTAAAGQESNLRIHKVRFDGNETFSDRELREVVMARSRTWGQRATFWRHTGQYFDEIELRRDVVRLNRFYQRRGFPDVRITPTVISEHPWKREIRFRISEGRPIRVVSVEPVFLPADSIPAFALDRGFQRRLARLPLRVNRRYEPLLLPDTETALVEYLQNTGHAFGVVRVDARVDTARSEAHVFLRMEPGPIAMIGTVHTEGNVSVPDRLVIRESGLRTGTRFSKRAMARAQRELFSHHLFRFATVAIPDQPADTTVDLVVRVREFPLRSIRAQVGLGNEEYARAQLSWTHRNPFGNAHSLSTSARASYLEQRLNLDYLIPYAFNTSSSFLVSPFGQRRVEEAFILYRAGSTNSLIYRYNQDLAATASYEISQNREVRSSSVALEDTTQLYNQSAVQLSGYYQRTLVERNEGWAIRPFYEWSGLFGMGSVEYHKVRMEVRRYVNLNRTTQLALRVETGALFAAEIDELPSNVRFYAGGTSSVRGYGRWELGPKRQTVDGPVPEGGRAVLTFNTEWRQELDNLVNGIGFGVFFDGGQVWRRLDQSGVRDLRYAAGAGLSYRSPVGPVRLDVGYKLNPGPGETDGPLGRWGIHFSIGNPF